MRWQYMIPPRSEEIRLAQLSSVDQAAWVVLETSGKLSIIPKKS